MIGFCQHRWPASWTHNRRRAVVNAATGTGSAAARGAGLGVHRERELPSMLRKVRSTARPAASFTPRDGGHAGEVAVFGTCYGKHEPIPATSDEGARAQRDSRMMARREAGCGMPKLELGDLDSGGAPQELNIPVLGGLPGTAMRGGAGAVRRYFKRAAAHVPDDADVTAVAAAMFDPSSTLVRATRTAAQDGFKTVSHGFYQVPCHLRVQNMGQKTRELLEMIPGRKSIPSSAARATTAPGG